MSGWHERYFSSVDPAVFEGLAAEAGHERSSRLAAEPQGLIEELTGGLRFPLVDGSDKEIAVLVPQHHLAPLNRHVKHRSLRLIQYPVELPPAGAGVPARRLVRIGQALGDETRLRILRCISRQQRPFAELADALGLPKSTLHHHLVILRAAGLVRVLYPFERRVAYGLRQSALHGIGEELERYIFEE